MTEEKKQYVLYDYLVYFWSKKIWFVIIPIITALIVAAAVYVLRHDSQKYTGEARVYTGGVNSLELTNTENIAEEYPTADVFVSEKGQVKFTVHGKTQDEAQKELDKVTNEYNQRLLENYNVRVNLTNQALAILNKRSKILKGELIPSYENRLKHGNLLDDQKRDLTMLSLDANVELTKVDEKIISMTTDLALFEKPKVLTNKVFAKKSYIPEGLVVGLILGLLFAVGFLMMLKYMSDARRYYNHG